MKRRQVMLAGLGAACGLLGLRIALSRDESAIVKVVYKRLPYLRLDHDGVRQFARDIKGQHMVSSLRLHLLDTAGSLYTGSAMAAHNSFNDALHHGEDRIVSQYLISSDFFRYGADEARTVQYLGYYDPMVPCNNPFARTMAGPPPAYPGHSA